MNWNYSLGLQIYVLYVKWSVNDLTDEDIVIHEYIMYIISLNAILCYMVICIAPLTGGYSKTLSA